MGRRGEGSTHSAARAARLLAAVRGGTALGAAGSVHVDFCSRSLKIKLSCRLVASGIGDAPEFAVAAEKEG